MSPWLQTVLSVTLYVFYFIIVMSTVCLLTRASRHKGHNWRLWGGRHHDSDPIREPPAHKSN